MTRIEILIIFIALLHTEAFLLKAFIEPINKKSTGSYRSFDTFLHTLHDNLRYQFGKYPAGMHKEKITQNIDENLHDEDRKLWFGIFEACDIWCGVGVW